MGIISEEERKGGNLGQTMGDRIVLEFGGGKELGPLVRIIGTKDTEISFYFLIGSFGLSVGLGMIGSG